MKKALLVFDLDGTLVDSAGDIIRAANMTLSALGRKTLPDDAIMESIGWGVTTLLERLMPDKAPEEIIRARGLFLEIYGEHLVEDTYIYPGVLDTLEHFRDAGMKMAVVTNKPEGLSRSLLTRLGLMDFFMALVGGDTLKNRKPHPQPLIKAIELAGVSAGDAAIVGDSPVDCETGRMAGVFTVGVSYGFRDLSELRGAGCDVIIDRFNELMGLFG